MSIDTISSTPASDAIRTAISPAQWRSKARLWLADAGAVGAAIVAASVLTSSLPVVFTLVFVISGAGWATQRALYRVRFLTRRSDEARRVIQAVGLAAATTAVAVFVVDGDLDRMWLATTAVGSLFGVGIVREVTRRRFDSLRRDGTLLRQSIVVGAGDEVDELVSMLETDPVLGYAVCTVIDPSSFESSVSATTQVLQAARHHDASTVLLAASSVETTTLNRLIRDLVDAGIHVELSSSLADIAPSRLTMRPIGRFPVLYIEPVQRGGWRAAAKRSFDVVSASIGVLCLAPVFLLIGIAVKVTSPGPVLFRQNRVGRYSQPFDMLKFRTMVVDAEERLGDLMAGNETDGPMFKMEDDPRITHVGRILRKTSLDELPQLLNVIRGEMSLVGPRPALANEMAGWSDDLYGRLRVRPGITGMWQVSGRSTTTFDEYTRLDLYYVYNWSLLIDLAILAKTVPAVVSSKGAY